MGEDMGLHRLFVEEESYKRLKKAKEKYGEDMHDIEWEAVGGLLDEEGQRKKVILKEDSYELLLAWAEENKVTPDDLLNMLIGTVRTLFDPNLSLADALRSIPELAGNLGIPGAKKQPK